MTDGNEGLRLHEGSLVLYRQGPALVTAVGPKKITIVLPNAETVRVRPKDIDLLHPGPLHRLNELGPQEGELYIAWELLQGGITTLEELSELHMVSIRRRRRGRPGNG